jgi:nucleoside-diphosphate-sugar epimerase
VWRELPQAVIVRPPVVYGPRDTDVFEMIRGIAGGIELRIGRGERWFSAIYVADLVEGLLAAAQCPKALGRAYFLAQGDAVSWSGFAATAAKLLGRRTRKIIAPPSAAYAVGWMAEWWSRARGKPGIISRDKVREAAYPRWTCSPRRAQAELGFVAPTSLEDGLARTIAWYREQGWL